MLCRNCGEESGEYQLCQKCYQQKQLNNYVKKQEYAEAETFKQAMQRKVQLTTGMLIFMLLVAITIGLYIGYQMHK